MNLRDFAYTLPEELIAQYPHQQRDQARLLIVDRAQNTIRHDIFSNISQYLPNASHFVINNSKVIPARLFGTKSRTGGQVEVFLLKALEDDYSFKAMLRPLKRIQEGEVIEFIDGITATLVNREKRIVKFERPNILEYLVEIGHIPLPPYIKREDEAMDQEYYQTVYAQHFGSVAAPTAGLHFTRSLMESLKNQGHCFSEVTLHINYGTFKPVECEDITQHPMHFERYQVEEKTWELIKASKGKNPIVAVGTTGCRTLESIARGGDLSAETNLFIYPGFDFRMVDILLTNFHLPKSTLLMLVSAFGGMDLIKRAYAEAIKEKYRFYSYGDAMLIL